MAGSEVAWWAKGVMFENCNYRLLCRCHISYRQSADGERCIGGFAIEAEDGRFGDVALGGLLVYFAVDSPQYMLEGDWTTALVVDAAPSAGQGWAIEAILSGEAAVTWSVLANLVGRRLPTRHAPIQVEAEDKRRRRGAEGVFDTAHEPIKGDDGTGPVRLENVHNQVHGASQIMARGTTRFDAGAFTVATEGAHAIRSSFFWRGP
jgi:hypothetical protein